MPQSLDQPAWLEKAWAELGQHEMPGPDANPRIRDLFADAGHPEIVSDEVAWCAAFVSACLERAQTPSTHSLLARSYLDWGDALPEPRFGAIAVFSRDPDPSSSRSEASIMLGHVGFLIGATADTLLLLGGNQHNAVTVAPFPKSRLLSLRWPSIPSPRSSRGEGEGEGRQRSEGEGRQQVQSQATRRAPPSAPDAGSLFPSALAHVLEMEGGYTDDPADPGGPTNFGITLADYARYLHAPVNPITRDDLIAGLKTIPAVQVRAIYETFYWTPAGCVSLPPPLAFFHFDTAVNMGTGTAIRMLQTALRVTIDGEIGPATISSATRAGPAACLDAYAALRRLRYRSLSTFDRFGRGWLARVETTLARSKALISKGSNMTPDQSFPVSPKWWGQSLTIWGAVVTGLAAVLPALGPAVGLDVTPAAVHTAADQIGAIVQALAGLAGTLTAIYGRVRATQPLQQRLVTLKL